MPDPKNLSDLTEALAIGAGDLVYAAVEDISSVTGYYGKKASAGTLGTALLSNISFPLIFTKTTAQTAAGAINELAGTTLTGTLLTGSTTLTLSDASILTTSTVDIYTDTWGVNPTDVTLSTGSITLTFDAQASDIAVKVVIR